MRVAPEIAQDLARVRERGFRVDDPAPGSQRGRQALEVMTVVGRTVMQLALAARCGEEVQALSPEDLRQGPDGEQEAVARRGEPPFPVRAQAAVGDDAVDMNVLPEVLAPDAAPS